MWTNAVVDKSVESRPQRTTKVGGQDIQMDKSYCSAPAIGGRDPGIESPYGRGRERSNMN